MKPVHQSPLRNTLYEVIFGTESRAGRNFDLCLIAAILISVAAIVADSIASVNRRYGEFLHLIEWTFTLLFTVEYLVRLYCSPNALRYARSFYGLVDLVSFLPTYVAIFISGSQYLMVVRLLRVLRIFRILKLAKFLGEANVLVRALRESRRKVLVFLASVLVVTTVFGALMYVVEGPEHGFTSIPRGIYWAIVTVTTVGYGDVTPNTLPGQSIAALAMITGYAIIAVPTGIFTAEMVQELRREYSVRTCPNCERGGHERIAHFCKWCGGELPDMD